MIPSVSNLPRKSFFFPPPLLVPLAMFSANRTNAYADLVFEKFSALLLP